jgi:hypothetical protein
MKSIQGHQIYVNFPDKILSMPIAISIQISRVSMGTLDLNDIRIMFKH